MKKRYFLVVSSQVNGRASSLTATSESEAMVKRLWRLLIRRFEDGAVVEKQERRVVISVSDTLREFAYGSYDFSGEDPLVNAYTL